MALSVDRPAAPQHLEEARVVARGGGEPSAPGEAHPRAVHVVPLPTRPGVGAHESALGVVPIDRDQPLTLLGRDEEARVTHPEGLGEALPQEAIERDPARALDDAPQHIGVVAVDPPLPGLCDEGEGAESIHRGADRLAFVGGVPPEAGGRAEPGGAIALGDDRIGAVGDPGGVGEEIEDRDLPLGRGDQRPGVTAGGDGGAREGGEPFRGRIAERDPALFDEHHDPSAHERLGLRGDAEDRVGGHRVVGLAIGPSDGLLVDHLAIAEHHRDRATDLRRVDLLLQIARESIEPRGIEGGARVELLEPQPRAQDVGRLPGVPMAIGGGDEAPVGHPLEPGVGAIPLVGVVLDADAILTRRPAEEIVPVADPGDPIPLGRAPLRHVAEGDEEAPIAGVLRGVAIPGELPREFARRAPRAALIGGGDDLRRRLATVLAQEEGEGAAIGGTDGPRFAEMEIAPAPDLGGLPPAAAAIGGADLEESEGPRRAAIRPEEAAVVVEEGEEGTVGHRDHGAHHDDPAPIADRGERGPGAPLVLARGDAGGVEPGEEDQAVAPLHRVGDAVDGRGLEGGGPVLRGGEALAPGAATIRAPLHEDGALPMPLGVDGEDRPAIPQEGGGDVPEVLARLAVDDGVAAGVAVEVDEGDPLGAGRSSEPEEPEEGSEGGEGDETWTGAAT